MSLDLFLQFFSEHWRQLNIKLLSCHSTLNIEFYLNWKFILAPQILSSIAKSKARKICDNSFLFTQWNGDNLYAIIVQNIFSTRLFKEKWNFCWYLSHLALDYVYSKQTNANSKRKWLKNEKRQFCIQHLCRHSRLRN